MRRILHGTAVALILALVAGCEGGPRPIRFESPAGRPDTADGLYRVRATRVAAAFVKPGARFSDYDGLLIDPVTVSYQRDAPAPRPRELARDHFELDPVLMDRLKRIFQESFEAQLSRSNAFAVVSEPGPGVLRVSGHIIDLSVQVPRFRGGEVNLMLNAGAMTLLLDVRDSETGAPLARIADRRAIRPHSAGVVNPYRSGPANNWAAVREIFQGWARILRAGLDELRQLPEIPAPPAPESEGESAGDGPS